jgi:hypothetical protein
VIAPTPVKIIGHDIEVIDVVLQDIEVIPLGVPVGPRIGPGDEPFGVGGRGVEAIPHLLDKEGKIRPVRGVLRKLPVDVGAIVVIRGDEIFKVGGEGLPGGGGRRDTGEVIRSRSRSAQGDQDLDPVGVGVRNQGRFQIAAPVANGAVEIWPGKSVANVGELVIGNIGRAVAGPGPVSVIGQNDFARRGLEGRRGEHEKNRQPQETKGSVETVLVF